MKIHILFLCAFCLCGIRPAYSDTENIPKERPLIIKAPDVAAWSIALVDKGKGDGAAQVSVPGAQSQEAAGADPNAVVKWNFRKGGNVECVDCVTRSGKTGSVWMIGEMQVVQLPGQTSWTVNRHVESSMDPFWQDLGPYGYPHTAIVSSKTYLDTVHFLGKRCLRFGTQVHDPIEEDPAKGNYDIWVYVDEKSRLPVYAAGLVNAYTFNFSQPPQPGLTPPAEVTKVLENEIKRRDRLDAVPPHA